jgi:hypothetical protein
VVKAGRRLALLAERDARSMRVSRTRPTCAVPDNAARRSLARLSQRQVPSSTSAFAWHFLPRVRSFSIALSARPPGKGG